MKQDKLMDSIGQIDDDIILEAEFYTKGKKSVKKVWAKWALSAAVIGLIVTIPILFNRNTNIPEVKNLPKLTVNDKFGDMGFEGLMAYDISELKTGNPWTEENDLTTLPVFNNPNEYDGAGCPVSGLSAKEMYAKTKNIARLFNLKIKSLSQDPTKEEIKETRKRLKKEKSSKESIKRNTMVRSVTAQCEGVEIKVEKDGNIILEITLEKVYLLKEIKRLNIYNSFDIYLKYEDKTIGETMDSRGFPLPGGYKFTFDNTSGEDALKTTRYLFNEYGDFSGIKTPGYDTSADYTFDGDLRRLHTFVFENKGSLTERILNYNFTRLYFSATSLGGLGGITYNKTDLSEKIGDYPIITAKEARKLLVNGRYITTVPEKMPGEKYIAGVGLEYRTSRLDSVFMPYYRFLVEMPAMKEENGLKTFGAYYVPAVKSEYLENMEVWDGRFN